MEQKNQFMIFFNIFRVIFLNVKTTMDMCCNEFIMRISKHLSLTLIMAHLKLRLKDYVKYTESNRECEIFVFNYTISSKLY